MQYSITQLVNIIRGTLEEPRIKSLHEMFRNFPKGSCSDAASILGKLLHEHGFGEWQIALAERHEPFGTHAWIQKDKTIIDITADQFEHSIFEWITNTSDTVHPYNSYKDKIR